MNGLGSRNNPPWHTCLRGCPTLSHAPAAGGQRKCRPFGHLSHLSHQSHLIKTDRKIERQRKEREVSTKGISAERDIRCRPPAPRRVRRVRRVQQIQAFMVRQQGRDTGGTAETHIVASRPRVPRVSPPHRRHRRNGLQARSFAVSVSTRATRFSFETARRDAIAVRRIRCNAGTLFTGRSAILLIAIDRH
jgi:hypothetical protein